MSAFLGSVPAACEGSRIDLAHLRECRCARQWEKVRDGQRWIRSAKWCGPEFDGLALPAEVEVSLAAEPAVVAPGGELRLVLRLRNRATRSIPVRIEDAMIERFVIVRDDHGNDAIHRGPCGTGISSTHDEYLVVLASGGQAVWSTPLRAIAFPTEMRQGSCHDLAPRPFPPGRYHVELRVPFASPLVKRTMFEVR